MAGLAAASLLSSARRVDRRAAQPRVTERLVRPSTPGGSRARRRDGRSGEATSWRPRSEPRRRAAGRRHLRGRLLVGCEERALSRSSFRRWTATWATTSDTTAARAPTCGAADRLPFREASFGSGPVHRRSSSTRPLARHRVARDPPDPASGGQMLSTLGAAALAHPRSATISAASRAGLQSACWGRRVRDRGALRPGRRVAHDGPGGEQRDRRASGRQPDRAQALRGRQRHRAPARIWRDEEGTPLSTLPWPASPGPE